MRQVSMAERLCSLLMGSAHAVAADFTPPNTDAEQFANAASAAPAAVGNDPTVIDIDAKGNLRTLRKGTNSWVCNPARPSGRLGNDPQCMDENGWAWILASPQAAAARSRQGRLRLHAGRAEPTPATPIRLQWEPAHGMPWIITPSARDDLQTMGILLPDYPQVLLGEKPDTSLTVDHVVGHPCTRTRMIPVQ